MNAKKVLSDTNNNLYNKGKNLHPSRTY